MSDSEGKADLVQYGALLGDVKTRIQAAQNRASQAVNLELLRLYWEIGAIVASRQQLEGWGSGIIPKLAADLRNDLPEVKGFSQRNLFLMVQFNLAYPDLFPIVQPPVAQLDEGGPENATAQKIKENLIVQPHVAQLGSDEFGQPPVAQIPRSSIPQTPFAQLPWAHNVLLLQRVKDMATRTWYGRQALEQGWSRDTLAAMLRTELHLRQGSAVTNFATSLPAAQSALALERLKDPYIFDFLTLTEPFLERELETGLVAHIQKFLLELGRGFAFVGRQYRLAVSDQDYYLDLLFYHLTLRCFVVVDLKRGDFQPEYAGKMNFYCSAVDEQLRHADDQPTIGLILCQTKDRIIAEYSLRDIAKPIGVADYELARALPESLASSLPSIEMIEAELLGEASSEGGT
jgi:predicted nuclease of restriction endonuclease-like (RecB) superfamily